MSDIVIFDTSVLVDDVRTGRHQQRIAGLSGLIRMSSVVLAELWRGATSREEQEWLRALERTHPVLVPTETNWRESGQILGRMRREKGLAPAKLRDLHFDVLIALTARSHGARLITSNRTDFELIRQYRDVQLELW